MTTDGAAAPQIRIQIVHALPAAYWTTHLLLPQAATVADALASAGPAIEAAGIIVDPGCLAIFGTAVEPRARLHDGDRIELLRPLLVNPRDARTNRASASGSGLARDSSGGSGLGRDSSTRKP